MLFAQKIYCISFLNMRVRLTRLTSVSIKPGYGTDSLKDTGKFIDDERMITNSLAANPTMLYPVNLDVKR